MADVFISYARRSARQAEAAAQALRALGFSVWFDADIPANRAYSHVIQEELEQAKAALVLWSEDASRSEWVLSEADRARNERKLVQVKLDPTRLPMPFDQIQCADLSDWQGDLGQAGWRKVVATISDLVMGAADAGSPPASSVIPAVPVLSERRRLTFLTCHIVGAVGLAARLDPEVWLEVSLEFNEICRSAIEHLGGHLKRSGEGLVAYFGYPIAQEDAAERAVRAGLAIADALLTRSWPIQDAQGDRLAVRVGVHAGTVVVVPGDGGYVEMFGDAPTVAALVEGAADPGMVLVSGAVHELVAGRFVTEDLGRRTLEGVPAPLHLFRVVQADAEAGRGPAAAKPTPFVGRDEEFGVLCSRWERVRDGEGQLVLVTGEAGIGKSRIVKEFCAQIRSDAHLWIECSGAALYANTPFHALVQICLQAIGSRGDEPEAERLALLEAALRRAGLKLDESVPIIAEILGLVATSDYAPLSLTPDQRRARLFAVFSEWILLTASAERPLVIVVEDLHWVDPSTIELIQILSEQGATAPLMLLLTARPHFQQAWRARGHHAQISLDRLSNRATRALVEGVVSGAGLVGDLVEMIIKRSDGVPLFAEELGRLVLQDRHGSSLDAIPANLLDSLTARLDRLGPAKEVAQLASVLGREFSYELVRAVSTLEEASLQSRLKALLDAELIHVRGAPPRASYQFKHALVQDAAYESLLKRKRQEMHSLVARTITERFTDLASSRPELLAAHWARAGEVQPALAAWKNAGDAAYARRAFKESEANYRQGLELLMPCPPSSDRDAKELELCSALNRVLQLTHGYAAPETIEAASRARELAEKSGTLSELIREEARIWRSIITAGDYSAAASLADHIRELARDEGDKPGRLVFVHNAQLQTCYYTGDLNGVERCFAALSPLIDTVGLRQAPGNNIVSIGIASLTAWAQGRSAEAHRRMRRAIDFAEASDNVYDRAMALHFQGNLEVAERDADAAAATGSSLLALAQKNGFSYLASLALFHLGWARARKGAAGEGAAQIRQTIAYQAASGARLGMGSTLNRLAEAQQLNGATNEALATIEEALRANPQERIYRTESFRLRGGLRLEQGDSAGAETDLRMAIDLAREMGANAYELRAGLDLARLLRACGRISESRALLEPIRAGFAADDENLELRDADEVLARLGA